MAARAAATRRLPTLLSLGGCFRSGSCFMGQTVRALSQAAEVPRGTRIYGAPLKQSKHLPNHPEFGCKIPKENCYMPEVPRALEVPRGTRIYGAPLKQRKHFPRHPEFGPILPKDYERSVSEVWESKCSTPLQHFTANISLKPKPKRDIILHHIDVDGRLYFTAYSLDEDGTLVRKYDIYPPAAVDGKFGHACSCNGLILFANTKNELLLWNPTTNEFKILPQPYVEQPGVEHLNMVCAMSSDHGSEDYKVLVIVMVTETDEKDDPIDISHDIALYSLRDNSWKIIPFPRKGYEYWGICFNGLYYTTGYMEDGSECILSFDFATATLSSIPLPNYSKSDYRHLMEYNGRLGVVVYSRDEVERSYGLWVMNDDGSWSKETVFHTNGVRLVCFSEKGELVYFQNFRDELLVFDRATGKLKTLGSYSINGCMQFIPFCESFVRLKEQEQAQVQEEEEVVEKDYERFVSKVWESECSTPLQHFAANFSLKPKPKRDIFLHHIDVDDCFYFTAYSLDEDGTLVRKYDIYPPAAVQDGIFRIVCGCNGLILYYNLKNELLLWNPTTNEFKILPQPYVEQPGVEHLYTVFAMSSDHGSEDYKVLVNVMVIEEDNPIDMSHYIALYSLRDNSWKIIPSPRYHFGHYDICVNGIYYNMGCGDQDTECILSFDFATATLSSIPLPNYSKLDYSHIVEYNGRLGILVYSLDEVERSYGLWVMNDDGSWSKETVFHTNGFRLVCFSEKGELVYFQNFRDELLVFDRATGKLKTLGSYSINGCMQFIPFCESFVRLEEQEQEQAQVREEVVEVVEKDVEEAPLAYA